MDTPSDDQVGTTAGSVAGRPTGPFVGRVAAAVTLRSAAILAAAILAVAATAVAVLVLTSRGSATYPAGSPEAAFQAYLVAWEKDDIDAAWASFSDRIHRSTTLDEYRAQSSWMDESRWADQRVVLVESQTDADRATLRIRIDSFSGGGLGGSAWSRDESIPLVREGGTWYLDVLLVGIEQMWP